MPDQEMIEKCVMAANSQFIGKGDIINIIKAMREPTEKMLKSGYQMQDGGGSAQFIFESMIDSILND